jgi:Domain of unknown function DUF29
VGGSPYRDVRSRVRTIMELLLKLEHSAASEPRAGWERTIRRERADLAEDLERSLARFYEVARIGAAAALRAHGEDAAAHALPTTCPLHPRPDHRRLAAGPRSRGERSEHFLTEPLGH